MRNSGASGTTGHYVLAFLCIVLLGTGTLMYSPIIIPYTRALGGLAVHGTSIEGISKLIACIGVVYVGHISSFYGRKRTLISIYLLGAVGGVVAGFAPSPVWLLVSSTISSLSFASMGAVMMTYLAEIAPEGRHGTALGVFGTGIGVSASISAVLATTLAEHFGFRLPFLLAAAGILVGALLIRLFFVESLDDAAAPREEYKGISGLKLLPLLLKANVLIVVLYLGAGAYQFLQSSLSTLLTPLVEALGYPLSVAGIGIGAYGVFGLMQPLGGRVGDRFGRRAITFVGALLFLVGMLTLYVADSHILVLIGTSLFGIGTALYVPSLSAQICMSGPAETRGAAMGLYQAMLTVGAVLGPVTGGFVLQNIGPRAPFLLNSGVIGGFFLLLVAQSLFGKKARETERSSCSSEA